jgi:hypothetical protein
VVLKRHARTAPRTTLVGVPTLPRGRDTGGYISGREVMGRRPATGRVDPFQATTC